jgi:hypothetical protein
MQHYYPRHITDRIKFLAQSSPDEEVGGVVVSSPKGWEVLPIENVSLCPADAYIANPIEVFRANGLGQLDSFWHSHVKGMGRFSGADITGIWETMLAWLPYDVKGDGFDYFDPNERYGLLGRKWELGLFDCCTVIRDFYRWELGIELPPSEHDGVDKLKRA